MELTKPNSQFLVVDSDDIQQIEALSVMFPRLTNMIRNNRGKNLVLNFRDEQQRSLIVMIVSKSNEASLEVQMAS
jgi:hypothetical protein